MRWRRFFRAGGPLGLTDVDAGTIGRLELGTIIDLRTVDEATTRGQYRTVLSDITTHHLPMTDLLPPEDELVFWSDPAFVADQYMTMLIEGGDAITEALAVLTDPSAYPALIHCSAGKDRTGVFTALVLGLLGVDDSDIIRDYALSHEAMRQMLDWLARTAPDQQDVVSRYAPAILSAEPETMRVFLERLRVEFGSFDGYADEALHVPKVGGYLRAQLLA